MTIQSLYTAATGMEALETKMDVIANNLANVSTVGFKRDRANFEDLMYRYEALPGALDTASNPSPTGTAVGMGVKVSGTQTIFAQGTPQQTEGELDITIMGNGFLPVTDAATGEILYTRAGNLSLNANGQLVTGSATTGRLLNPPITIPQDHTGISIQADGKVRFKLSGTAAMSDAGQIQLAAFPNAAGLMKIGENLYAETDSSGTAQLGNPGQQGLGDLQQGYLEASNVEPVKELIDLITTQRSFELNSQAIQAGDDMLQEINNLRRF